MSKGAYKYESPGAKSMSGARTGMSGKGRMSGAHGLVQNKSPTKGMKHPEGRVGDGCYPFGSGNYRQAGPVDGGGAGHKKQPKGHKSDA